MPKDKTEVQPHNFCATCKGSMWDHRDWCSDPENRLPSDLCARCRKPKGEGEGFCRCGRPSSMTPAVIQALETAFSYGATDKEACLHAGITTDTLLRYERKNPDFRERKHELKEMPSLKARKAVVDALDKDPDLALKFLERKKADEFAPTAKVKNTIELELHQIHGEIVGDTRSVVDEHVIDGEIVDKELPADV